MSELDNLDQIGHAMMLAWGRIKKAQARMWGDWMAIGEGLMEGRRWAMRQAGVNKPEGKGYVIAYAEWLKRYKVDDMDKSDRAKILQLMEERPAVEEWRASLTDHERRNLNNPVIAWRRWTAATRVRKPRALAATAGRSVAMIEQQAARIAELEEELATQTPSYAPPGYAPPATLDGLCEALAALLGDAPKDARMRAVEQVMKTLDLSIHDWADSVCV